MPRSDMDGDDMPRTERDLNSRSKRQGGHHTFADVYRGPRTGFDGDVMRAVFGDSPRDFDKAIKWELEQKQRRQPGRYVKKIAPRPRARQLGRP